MNNSMIVTVYDWIKTILISLCCVFLLLTFAFRMVQIDGHSMDTTLANGERVIVTNFMYTPKQGDVVAISHGTLFPTPIIKRVIALPGQKIKIDAETASVYVDDELLTEPYIKNATIDAGNWDYPEIVPDGKVFVMGDNRQNSSDSRDERIGLINETDIIGKAQIVVYPFSQFKYLYNVSWLV